MAFLIDPNSDKYKHLSKRELEHYQRAMDIAQSMTNGQIDTLVGCLEQGPTQSGDLCSKADVVDLIQWGLVVPVIVKCQDGFYAATHMGKDVYKAYYGDASCMQEARANRITQEALSRAAYRAAQ